MASKPQRAFALILALVFLLTSVGFSGYVIWQIRQDEKNKGLTEALQKAQEQQVESAQKENNVDSKKLEGFTPRTEPVTSLEKNDLKVGDGKEASAGATVTVHYTGALVSDGTVFESSKDSGQPATFALSGLIQGWQDGIPGMRVGGTRRLVIPYTQAYGEAGSPPKIPGKADLVFDIVLLEVK